MPPFRLSLLILLNLIPTLSVGETAFRTRDFEIRGTSTPQGVTLRFAENFSSPPQQSSTTQAETWIQAYLQRQTPPPDPSANPSTPEKALTLNLHFPAPQPLAPTFTSTYNPADGREITTFQRDNAGITQSLLADGESNLFLIHFRANKPGALAFQITTSHGTTTRVHDRRFLTTTSPLGQLHLAVLPMESEVEPATDSITVRGEGEALILAFFLPPQSDPSTASGIWTSLNLLHGEFPNVFTLWTRLEKQALTYHRTRFQACSWISQPETALSRRFAFEQALHLAEGHSGPSAFASTLAKALKLPHPIDLPEPSDVTATGIIPPPGPNTFIWKKGKPIRSQSN